VSIPDPQAVSGHSEPSSQVLATSGPNGFLDAASGQRLHPAARAALLAAYDDGWADPARLYAAGRRSRLLLDAARASVAASLGARPDEVAFTSSGTAAVHLAVAGLARGRARAGDRLVTGAVEHSCVLQAGRAMESAGGSMRTVPVDHTGRVDVERYAVELAEPGVALAALQSANHEVGTVQPVELVAQAARAAGVPLLVDAAASVGRTSVPSDWDVLTASAHKWGGPSGVGVLAIRTGVRWRSPSPDDPREGGRVPGFPDVPAVLAAAAALEAVDAEREMLAARATALVARIRDQVPVLVPDVQVVGDPEHRLPHIVTFSCLYVDGESLVSGLDLAGFAISSGSACVADALVPSHVLAAMGVLTHGNVRVSLPYDVTEAAVDRFLQVLPDVVARIRTDAGAVGL
jgi:cysteine desulfurase